MQKSKISEQMFDFSLATIVGSVYDFDNVSLLNCVLFRVQGYRISIFPPWKKSKKRLLKNGQITDLKKDKGEVVSKVDDSRTVSKDVLVKDKSDVKGSDFPTEILCKG